MNVRGGGEGGRRNLMFGICCWNSFQESSGKNFFHGLKALIFVINNIFMIAEMMEKCF